MSCPDCCKLLESCPSPFAFASWCIARQLLVLKRIQQLQAFIAHARLWLLSMAYVPENALRGDMDSVVASTHTAFFLLVGKHVAKIAKFVTHR